MAVNICPHCGTANRTGSNFCNSCGTDLRGEEANRQTGEARPPSGGGQTTGTGTPPAPEQPASGPKAPGDQPWLDPDFVGEDDFPPDLEATETLPFEDVDAGVAATTDIPSAPGRLVSGVQGLLEPIRVAAGIGEGPSHLPIPVSAIPTPALEVAQARRIRALLAEEPLLASVVSSPERRSPSLWIPWVFVLIGVAIAVPVLLQLMRPTGEPRQWPGVAQAFAEVNQLPAGATVQIFWAYDPATAGELDMVVMPVMRDLMDRDMKPSISSLMPNGPATAQRLFAQMQKERSRPSTTLAQADPVKARFLPGGVTVLPSLARQEAKLAVVVAAQAEDVQAWLEQVAPLNHVPVVAVTAAGAAPALLPYLDSGQLAGLVSGFDGAYSYSRLAGEPAALLDRPQMRVQIVGQNMAMITLLGIIVAGNLVALFAGRRQDG